MAEAESVAWTTKNARRRVALYFETVKQRERLEAQFQKETNGRGRFSRWLLQKVELGASGSYADPELVDTLKGRIEELETAVEYERDRSNEYRDQTAALTQQVQDYAKQFAEIARKVTK